MSLKILVAEDNEDDFVLIRDAFAESGLPAEFARVSDGEQLMEYLNKRSAPDLILLDLKMPRKSGLEALREIKADAVLRLIPVIALSTSASEKDIREAYASGVNAYVRKPVGFTLFIDAAKKIYDFWFMLARRPQMEQRP